MNESESIPTKVKIKKATISARKWIDAEQRWVDLGVIATSEQGLLARLKRRLWRR